MLPAKNRLKIKSGSRIVFGNKKEAYTPFFKIVCGFTKVDNPPKIGLIVSGGVGVAVKRNRLRRLLSEAVRSRIENFPDGAEVLIIANKDVGEVSYEKICNSLDKALSRIRLTS